MSKTTDKFDKTIENKILNFLFLTDVNLET